MRSLLPLILAGFLTGCVSSLPQKTSLNDNGSTSIECTEAERKAREIAKTVGIRHDLDGLIGQLREEIARQKTVGGLELSSIAFADRWVYHGDGTHWFFRSGNWAMTIENEGAGPIHFCGTILQPQMDLCVSVDLTHGRYQFGTWRAEEWEYVDLGFTFDLEPNPEPIPICSFAIPVENVASGAASP